METINMQGVAEDVSKQMSFFQQFISEIQAGLLSFIIKVIFAFVVLVIGIIIIRLLRKAIKKGLSHAAQKLDIPSTKFIDQTINILLHAILFIIIAQYFGVSAASVIAILGSAGLTIGLAFQGALSNFAGGVLLLIHRPFQVGDFIVVGDGATSGEVKEIGIIQTTLVYNPRKTIIVPNGSLANSTITNLSSNGTRLLSIIVGISYNSSIEKAKEIMLKLAKADEHLIDDENLLVFVDELAESSINIGLRALVPQSEYITTKWRMLERIRLEFDKEGIAIPFKQVDVHIDPK